MGCSPYLVVGTNQHLGIELADGRVVLDHEDPLRRIRRVSRWCDSGLGAGIFKELDQAFGLRGKSWHRQVYQLVGHAHPQFRGMDQG